MTLQVLVVVIAFCPLILKSLPTDRMYERTSTINTWKLDDFCNLPFTFKRHFLQIVKHNIALCIARLHIMFPTSVCLSTVCGNLGTGTATGDFASYYQTTGAILISDVTYVEFVYFSLWHRGTGVEMEGDRRVAFKRLLNMYLVMHGYFKITCCRKRKIQIDNEMYVLRILFI